MKSWLGGLLCLCLVSCGAAPTKSKDLGETVGPNESVSLGDPVEPSDAQADRDGDRILDDCDSCPEDPESYNGYEDEDGCPDRRPVKIVTTAPTIVERIYFRKNQSKILPVTQSLIDAMVATLLGNPQITLVACIGRSWKKERDAWMLSQRRAEALCAAFEAGGVEADRLEAIGVGTIDPIANPAPRAQMHAVPEIFEVDGIVRARWTGGDIERIAAPVAPSPATPPKRPKGCGPAGLL